MKRMKKLTIVFLILGTYFSGFTQETSKRLIDGWEYRRQEVGGIYEIWRGKWHDFIGWDSTTLPHCINEYDAVEPDQLYYQGETWYRTLLDVKNPYPNGRTLLHFEGAGQKTKVFTYLTKVGCHVGGYDEFRIDMTESFNEFSRHEKFAKEFENKYPVAICCDNSRDLEMIPSDLSDFNLYGGLYRYLNLVYVPAISSEYLHIEPIVNDEGKTANVKVYLQLYNPEKLDDKLELKMTIKSPDGKIVHTENTTYFPFLNKKQIFNFSLKKPELWSPDAPNLYTCEFSLNSVHGEQKMTEKFGFRFFEFKEKGPFYLNGQRLLLRGTHRHEDHAGVAAAMTEDMIRKEMKMMKEIGINFIRLGHYQQSSIVLECCDELGILVWEEIPWCRGGLGGETYKQQAKRMLTNMINQHYNHPSVIIWGIGNENDWKGDFEVFDKQAIREFMADLHHLSHLLDPSRKTAIRRCEFCADIVDVYSPSIWAGWYRGKFTDYQKVSRKEMEKVNHFLHVEWGASHHARRHSENPDKGLEKISSGAADEREGDFLMSGGDARASKDGDWTETYACNLIDWHLKEQEKMDWLTGTAYWPFKDFSTPVRPNNPVPYVNQKGIVERDFTKKETFYVFQSYWTEKPMVHIYGHTWESRWGKEGEEKVVKVYSNCPEVELIVNGKLLGKKTRNSQDFPAAGLRWTVKFNKGGNTVKAIGYKDKITVIDEITTNYQTDEWSKPAQLKLTKYAESGDTVTVKAEIFDENGIKCLDAVNFIRFDLNGDGKLIDNLGTSTAARRVQLYNGTAYISLLKNNGKSVVSLKSEGMKTQFLTIE